MHKEIADMTNEEMFTAIIARMDSMESELNGRMDNLESDIDIEFQAVRMEMNISNDSLKRDISILNDKIDRLMYTKDVDGYEKMKMQVEMLTQGYQELREEIG